MSTKKATLLIADDDPALVRSITRSFERQSCDFNIVGAHSPENAIKFQHKLKPESIVLDLSIDSTVGVESGYQVLDSIIKDDPTVRVLVLTGHGAEEYGVRALNQGAASFLVKPVDTAHLLALVRDGISSSRLRRQYDQLSSGADELSRSTGLRSRNRKMQAVLETVAFAASNTQPVLIIGETGSGKGVIAQAIHSMSSRRSKPLIRVHPRFGSSDIVSSEIFGHQKGAFTGAIESRRGLIEEANQGTLFIDEVDELPPETQILLLHVLQEKVFRRLGSNSEIRSDFRLIAATNQPIAKVLKQKKLREDFYHRIAHLVIEIPPLRDRPEDISDLAEQFLRTLITREKLLVHGFSRAALTKLLDHGWPGNVRELLAAVEHAGYRANFGRKRFVEPDDITFQPQNLKSGVLSGAEDFRDLVRGFEEQLVQEALLRCDHNQSKAAESLHLDRTSFRRILARIEGK